MKTEDPLLPRQKRIPMVSADAATDATGVLATRDHDVIRHWAGNRRAEPATGEATASGPATIDVKDGGAGIRFNFPSVSRFRPITWEEWFDNFDRHELIFVYDERPEDGGAPSPRYRIVKGDEWSGQFR
jgi:hypothetical protein